MKNTPLDAGVVLDGSVRPTAGLSDRTKIGSKLPTRLQASTGAAIN